MVRRVKAYLAKMKVITDEEKLHELSISCEGSSGGGSMMGTGPIRKRHPSPTLSTASSASSASEGLKNTGPKFGKYIVNLQIIISSFVIYISYVVCDLPNKIVQVLLHRKLLGNYCR